jgi:hypothetical protein
LDFAALLVGSTAAHADANDKACILKAAETLPKIAGLVIKKTRTKVMPTPARWPSATPPIVVDVDIVAAGQAETYSYLCAVGDQGAIVQRLAREAAASAAQNSE